ncbi:MAG: hypothetical protein U0894_13080 [Pirellulales bacterium]
MGEGWSWNGEQVRRITQSLCHDQYLTPDRSFGITYVVAVGLIILGALLVVGLAPKGIIADALADSAALQYRASIGAVAVLVEKSSCSHRAFAGGFAISNSLVAGQRHWWQRFAPVSGQHAVVLLWIGAGLRSSWLQGAFRVSSAGTARSSEPAH